MIDRKKKIKIIQLSLLVIGSLVLFFTYANKSDSPKEEIVSKEIQERIKNQNTNLPENSDIFYNIEYFLSIIVTPKLLNANIRLFTL